MTDYHPGRPALTTVREPAAPDDIRAIELSQDAPDWFGVIFDRYFAEIHGYVARRLGDDVADDIAAETFLTALRKRHRFDASRGIVRGWLYGIATNHISRHRRREQRGYRAMARAVVATLTGAYHDAFSFGQPALAKACRPAPQPKRRGA